MIQLIHLKIQLKRTIYNRFQTALLIIPACHVGSNVDGCVYVGSPLIYTVLQFRMHLHCRSSAEPQHVPISAWVQRGIMCPHISPWPFPKNKRQVKAVDENTFILSLTSAMIFIPTKCQYSLPTMPKRRRYGKCT